MDAFDPCVLTSSCTTKIFDFLTISQSDLENISMPLELQVGAGRGRAGALESSDHVCVIDIGILHGGMVMVARGAAAGVLRAGVRSP